MRQGVLWLGSLALTGCYFSPDTYREPDGVMVGEAGVDAGDATAMVGLDANLDARASDAGDGAVDAGCTSDLQCPLAFPQCRNGDCVPCAEQNDCARFAETPVCGADGKCVECTTELAQLCSGDTPACKPSTNTCVGCVADSDCPTEAKAACANDTCGACVDDSDCARFDKVCNRSSGACVTCRPETESMDCPGTACDPKMFTCTTRQRGSVTTCNACVSDSECVADHRCIPMKFGDADVGGFCLKRATPNCARPYFTLISRASANGAAAENYCGPNEAVTTCAAMQLFNSAKSCTNDAACGVQGAICDAVGPAGNLCTYSCSFSQECYENINCGGTNKHCGGT